MIALIDYGAGNLTSVRKALRGRRRGALHAGGAGDLGGRDADRRARRRPLRAPPRALDAGWRDAIRAAVGARRAAPRHLPRPAVAVRRQRRSAGRAGARAARAAAAARLPPTLKVPHVGWNALSIRAAVAAARRHPGRHAGVLHALVRRAVTTRAVATTSTAAPFAAVVETRTACSACSSTRRSPADAGLRILRNFVAKFQIPDRMLAKRLIACLDVRNGCVVKGVQFEGLRNAGDPAALARRYNARGHRRAGHPRRHRDAREPAGAGRHDPRGLARSCSSRSPSAAASGR